MDNLDQKIKEFGDYVLQTAEFARFQKAAENLENNEDAISTIQDLQEHIQTVTTLQQNGLSVSDKQRKELSAIQTKMQANKICTEYLISQNVVTVIARNICNSLTSITGIPFSSGGGGGCCG